ncbi:ABC transporter substrate-binding protein [Amycolatopsis sp. NPDC098790]|uniref:ABC transporter substrate-binding protein n=1 Tax=Amycolatopsis sp. NPDC098790 TaxID=3363939 RepID=UPI00380E8B6A
MTTNSHPVRRTVRITALALGAALALTACAGGGAGKTSTAAATGNEVAKVTIGVQSPPRSMDIAHASDYPSERAIDAAFDRVLALDNAGKVVPWLAESWQNPDPLTYVFTLRQGVTFWDGSPLTADDVVFSLQRHLDPKLGSEVAGKFADVKAIAATDGRTVTVTLGKPSASFLYNAAIQWTVLEKKYAEAAGADLGTPAKPGMGTGPYSIDSYSSSDGVTLTRFDGYWGAKPKIKTLVIKAIADPEAARLALLSHDIDGYFDVPLIASRKYDKLDGVSMTYADGSYVDLLSMNAKVAPFDDPKVREALAHLVDRQGLNGPLFNERAKLSTSIVPAGQLEARLGAAGAKSVLDKLPKVPAFDVAAAKAALAASGHPGGFTATVNVDKSQPWMLPLAQNLAENAKQLGITITPNAVSSATWATGLSAKDRGPLQLVALGATSPDIAVLPGLILGDGGSNVSQLTSPELVDQLATLRGTTDPAKVAAAVEPVLAAPLSSLAYLPLFDEQAAFALNKDLVWADGGYSTWSLGQVWPLSIRSTK